MKRVMMMTAALMAMVLALPALAQSPLAGTPAAQTGFCPGGRGSLDNLDFNTFHAHKTGGTTYRNASPLTVLKAGQGDHTRDLYIAKAENWTAARAVWTLGLEERPDREDVKATEFRCMKSNYGAAPKPLMLNDWKWWKAEEWPDRPPEKAKGKAEKVVVHGLVPEAVLLSGKRG